MGIILSPDIGFIYSVTWARDLYRSQTFNCDKLYLAIFHTNVIIELTSTDDFQAS